MKAKVYFCPTLTPETVVKMYRALEHPLPGKVAVKIHTGEEGNQNYLPPEFMRPIVDEVKGTVVECNTAYDGERDTTEKHKKLIHNHGWDKYFPFVLMDEEGPDAELPIPNGKRIKVDYVGKKLMKFDSLLVVSHFKGHPMGGYGGALKQLSIGCASSYGKAYIHGAGKPENKWTTEQDAFLESMADAASAVYGHFAPNCAFISVMKNLSVDCDCCAVAEDPCMKDIGILASLDPVALDQACLDLIYASSDPGKKHFLERVESRHGIHTIEAAVSLGFGTREYELIQL